MRRLMWFAIGFTAACGLFAYLEMGLLVWVVAAASLLAGIVLLFLKNKPCRISAVVLMGLCAGLIWCLVYDGLYWQSAKDKDGATMRADIQITDYSYDTRYGMAADGLAYLDGKPFRARVYLDKDDPLKPGDRVSGEFRLRFTAKGSTQGSTYHQGNGIFLLAYAQDDTTIQRNAVIPWQYFPAQLRMWLSSALDRLFPEDTKAFAKALLLGDSTDLPYETDSDLKISGIRHIIAVSGLHVSILFSLVYILFGKRRWPTALIGIPVLLLFAAVAGFTPSIVRACVMQVLMILAMLLKREYDPPTALAFAVLCMLVCNPAAVTSVSLQLSAGCMAGIFLFSKNVYDACMRLLGDPDKKKRKGRIASWICGSVSVSLSAMSLTTPLCAFYFGMVSLVGVVTNLLTLWIISFIFYGIMLVCAIGAFWSAAGMLMASVLSWPIRFVLWIADLLASFPWAAVYTCSIYIVIWLVLVYALLAVLLMGKKKYPALACGCAAVGLALSLFASYMESVGNQTFVTVLDVGQGQCILFQKDGKSYMVDCGGENEEAVADLAAAHLLSRGITRLDGIIVTHYDMDHAGGVPLLLSRIKADTLYLPTISDDGSVKETLQECYGDRICWIAQKTVLSLETGKITLFAGDSQQTENESSLCVLFQTEKCDILITGDRSSSGERTLVEKEDLPELELLVAGHHGSKSATGLELLSETSPATVVFSVGAENPYGHPSEEVMERVALFGCRTWRTDLDGTLYFKE